MSESIIGFLRCPKCAATGLKGTASDVTCRGCGARYPIADGILDMMPRESTEYITPFQRIMQTPLVVSVYERYWRRLGYFLASSRSFEEEVATIVRLQQDPGDGMRLLDLACGTGVFTRPLARRSGGWTVGLDLSLPMLRHAHRLALREGLGNIVLIRGTAFRIPFIAGTFSRINCCGALHLFARPEQAMEELARVLHREGSLTIQTTIRPRRSAGLAYLLERLIRFGFFDEDQLREKLRLHGFKVLAWERHRISCTLLARHIS